MACPYFMPTRRSESHAWLHPARLPLGAGWEGQCTAPGHESTPPSSDEVRELCNLGYAAKCSRLPAQRAWDAVRFSIVRHGDLQIQLVYVCETDHLPAAHGTLEYSLADSRWNSLHQDPRIQRMAECYLQSYLLRKSVPEDMTPRANP